MPMQPRYMGFGGYGNQQVVESDYYGPQNPGQELAQAIGRARAGKRADEQAAAQEKERQATAAWREEQTRRQAEMDPITMAIARAHLRGLGVRGPGEDGGGGGGDGQAGLPPAGIMAGSRSAPIAGVGTTSRNASGPMPSVGNRTQGMDSGFLGPMGQRPESDPGFTAHQLPGAFNPDTGQHNPADIDLGGGFRMPYSATPEGRQGISARELMESGIPNMTPALALYLSQHPEHVGPMLAQARGRSGADPYGPESIAFHEHMRDYEAAHPLRDQPEMTLAGALQEVDRVYGKGTPGGAAETLGADKRMQLAQQMTRRGFNPQRMPLAGIGDRNARFQARTGRTLPAQAPEEQQSDTDRENRNRQLRAVTGMIPKGADPARVREILRQHGVTDEEAEGILNPPKAPAPAAAGRF